MEGNGPLKNFDRFIGLPEMAGTVIQASCKS